MDSDHKNKSTGAKFSLWLDVKPGHKHLLEF